MQQMLAQLGPPSLRCLEILPNGNVKLTWVPVTDPGGVFDSYEVYFSLAAAGPFSTVGTVPAVSFNTFTHTTNTGTIQSLYYYVRTKFGAGGSNSSAPSDTLRTIFLNCTQAVPDIKLNYNQLHLPRLTSTSPSFTINKEFPSSIWNTLGTSTLVQYADTLSICSASINYQISQSDASGCISLSNIKGDIFKDKKSPDEPQIDSISVLPNGQTIIAWKIPRDMDISKYRIYRNLGAYQPIDSVNGRNNTLYTFTTTAANQGTVGLEVAAIDSCLNIGSFNGVPTTMYLETLYDRCAYSTLLNWNAYPGMKGGVAEYRIYYSVNGAAYLPVGSTTLTTFTHNGVAPSQNISYFVRAFNISRTVSSSSNRKIFFSTQAAAPLFVYLSNASVVDESSIEVKVVLDLSKESKGIDILRSQDGVSFSSVEFLPFNGGSMYSFIDKSVDPANTSYYYKAVVNDSCGNPRVVSNTAKTILLKVRELKENNFKKALSWNSYQGYAGGVSGYNIFRMVNDVPPSAPLDQGSPLDTVFIDNLEDEAPNGSKIQYYVEAVEGITNPYGLMETSRSNKPDVYMEADVYVPNAFAPKGVNKKWLPVIHFADKSDYRVMVFDKWGQKLFETISDTEGWDGGNAKPDVYVYLIRYKNSRGEYLEKKGTFVML